MRDDFDPLMVDRCTLLDDVTVPDTWSRIQYKLTDPTPVERLRTRTSASIEHEPHTRSSRWKCSMRRAR